MKVYFKSALLCFLLLCFAANSIAQSDGNAEVKTEAELPEYIYYFIFFAVIIIAIVAAVMLNMKKNIAAAYGENNDKQPLREMVSAFYDKNSKLIFILILAFFAVMMKACIGEIMP